MRLKPTLLSITLILSTLNLSCMIEETHDIETSSAENETQYDPGHGWSLDWSDEFDGDSLDAQSRIHFRDNSLFPLNQRHKADCQL